MNKTLKINDAYFIRMFELDFMKRMELDPSDATPTTFFKFNKGNSKKILKMLHINPDDAEDKKKANEMLDEVKTLLEKNQFFNQVVVSRIDDWKI